MKYTKRVFAFLLAIALCLTPVSTVYADSYGQITNEEGAPEDVTTGPTDGDVTTDPTDPTDGEGSSGGDETSSSINISFNYDAEMSESGWYLESKDLIVVFSNTIDFEEIKLYYTNGTELSTDVPVEPQEDGTYKGVISGLDDGEYTVTAYAKGIDGVEQTNTFSFKLDTTGVDYSAVSAENLSILEGVGYTKTSYLVNDLRDDTSGIKSIVTMGEDGLIAEYSTGSNIIITKDVTSVVLSDIAGNSIEVPIEELISALCSSVVFDSVIPIVNISIDSEADYTNGSQKFYKDTVSVTVNASDDNLKDVVVYVNDEPVGTSTILEKEVTLGYKFEDSGDYNIKVVVTDKSGNEVSNSETFIIDKDPPAIGTMSMEGDWSEVNGKIYTSSTLSITGLAEDSLSGYNRVEVIKDSNVVGTGLPYVISESGTYSVRVFDNVGNAVEFSLSDLTGSESSYAVIDKELPVVEVSPTTVPDYSGSKGYWYKSSPVISVSVSDSNIKSVNVTLNIGDEKKNIYSGSEEIKDFLINTSDYVGTEFLVEVSAEDFSGNIGSASYKFYLDKIPPYSVTATADAPRTEKGGNVYYTDAFDVVVSAKDDGFGEVTYYLDDVGNKTGEFYDIGAGEHTIRVEDGLGNTVQELPLSDYLGWSGNNVVIVSENPSIYADGFEGSWVKGIPAYSVTAEDKVGIDSYSVSVNGVVISEQFFSELDRTNVHISFDLSTVDTAEDGVYNIEVSVKNNAGLVTKWSDTVKVDTVSPTIGSIVADGKWNEVDGKVYSNKVIYISGEASDTLSGVSTVVVMKDGESVSNSLPYAISSSGVYQIVITDNVGNSKSYNLNELMGTTSNVIVIDEEVPSLGFDSSTTTPDAVVNGVNWFNSAPVITIQASDNHKVRVRVVVSVDGEEYVDYNDYVVDEWVYDVDTSKYSGKNYVVSATATDDSGNTCFISYSFSIDCEKPGIGSLAIESMYEDTEEGAFSNKEFVFTGSATDIDSGISSLVVYREDVRCYESPNGSVDFSISEASESGVYSVVVTDKVGNQAVFYVKDLLGSKSNILVIDKSNPVIARTDEGIETSDGWYNYAPVLSFNVSDEHIKSYTVSINEGIVRDGNSSEKFLLDMSQYLNMAVSIKITAVDKAGNGVSYSYEYKHDNAPPIKVSSSSTTPFVEKNGFVYFNNDLVLSIKAEDAGYGDLTYYLNEESNKTGEFVVNADGEYFVKVTDGLGNESESIALNELLGWEYNSIIFDNEKPVVTAYKYEGQWVAKPPVCNFGFTDNYGIDRIIISVNGSELVKKVYQEVDVTKESLVVNLSDATVNTDGSYVISIEVVDNSGLSTVWGDVVYLDTESPYVSNFEIDGATNSIGNSINGEDVYGFFFNGDGTITVVANDTGASSGIGSIWTRFEGEEWVRHSVGSDKKVSIDVPKNFKGKFEAYAVDNVGNIGAVNCPDLLVSETETAHNNNSNIVVTLPNTIYRDGNGLPLYNDDIIVGVTAGCEISGIESAQWGIGGLTTMISPLNGTIKEKNLITEISQSLAVTVNENSMKVMVKVTDMVGHTIDGFSSFSIDKDKPVISVNFNSTSPDGNYNSTRTATVKVTERNFDPGLVKIEGVYGELGTWYNEGDTWINTITFYEDNDYQFTIDCTDRAGNIATQYVSEKFTVDKTAPVMSVTWDNNAYENENYYNSSRTATITVVEHNFDSSLFTISGSGSFSNWSNNGDTHTATVNFSSDGEYEFTINGADVAGNYISSEYNSGKFIIDLTSPVIEFSRISEGVSYKNNVEFIVNVYDTYINSNTKVYLSGKSHDEVELTGQFVGQSGTFSYTDFPVEESVDDIYTIRVVAVDNAGNVTEDTLMFSVNRYGSKYSFYDVEYLNNYHATPKDVIISEVNVDKLDTNKVVVSITKDGKEVKVLNSWVSISEEEVNGKFLYTYTISKDAFAEDGKYSVSILSQAEEGTQYTSASEQYDFVVDKSSPVVIISGIEDGETYHEYERTVSVDVRDLSGVSHVEFTVNGEVIEDYSKTDDIYYFTVGESPEYQSVVVKVVDMAGNSSTVRVDDLLITSNLMVYLINQLWFLVIVAFVLFLIVTMVIMLLLGRRKEKDEEQRALKASGELYRSSTSGNSSGSEGTTGNDGRILSGDTPTYDQGTVVSNTTTSFSEEDTSDSEPTGTFDDADTGVMEDSNEKDTGVME